LEDSHHGVEAAKNARMYCMAVPYLTNDPIHFSFNSADILFKKGIADFTADNALRWLNN
jgi:beta-phosphoglucomutase-like phosphatase (HAD superfamily)